MPAALIQKGLRGSFPHSSPGSELFIQSEKVTLKRYLCGLTRKKIMKPDRGLEV